MDSKELINLFEFPDRTIVNQTIFKVDLYNWNGNTFLDKNYKVCL